MLKVTCFSERGGRLSSHDFGFSVSVFDIQHPATPSYQARPVMPKKILCRLTVRKPQERGRIRQLSGVNAVRVRYLQVTLPNT